MQIMQLIERIVTDTTNLHSDLSIKCSRYFYSLHLYGSHNIYSAKIFAFQPICKCVEKYILKLKKKIIYIFHMKIL
jgi:hypothetical protein